ncbi:hypothetical protein HMN09_00672700 [Mycena chlorophos]|uniref:Uncharacterized protein n=1 Tax=Mycena chlorophos TaxID=658473 RepID=A0A8H6SYC1_MYCCL|nr:hypothetical protein HMN09_00672700 [Mycena chlorophos]
MIDQHQPNPDSEIVPHGQASNMPSKAPCVSNPTDPHPSRTRNGSLRHRFSYQTQRRSLGVARVEIIDQLLQTTNSSGAARMSRHAPG